MSASSRPCCLILEDQALIGMSLEAYLEEAGFGVAGPFLSNADATAWLRERTPDLALLDVMVKDGTCVDVAKELRARGVPLAIYSGLRPGTMLPPELGDVPWLAKPAERPALARLLAELVGQRAG
ncbi:MAG TPA: response regulator [Beijerinckiaceae bacterium]|nr:response regulator [Beijerinckiaceae bacterium]